MISNQKTLLEVLHTALARIDAAQPSSPALVKECQAVATKLLTDYELTVHNAERLHADFAAVADWQACDRKDLAR